MRDKQTFKRAIIVLVVSSSVLAGFLWWNTQRHYDSILDDLGKEPFPTTKEDTGIKYNFDNGTVDNNKPVDLVVIGNMNSKSESGYWHITFDISNNSNKTVKYGTGVIYFRDYNLQQIGSESVVFSDILPNGKITKEIYVPQGEVPKFKDYIAEVKDIDFN